VDYKGYSISDLQSELLYDILQTQQEILAELKRQNEPVNLDDSARHDRIDELIEKKETLPFEDAKQEVPDTKPVKKPAQRKPAKKKAKAKKATK